MSRRLVLQEARRKRIFHKVLEQAGLQRIKIHSLRHTFASQLIQGGEYLAYVRDQLGHYSIQLTVDTYGHLAPDGNKAAVDRLDDPNVDMKRTLVQEESDVTKRNLCATRKKRGANLNS
ncbi:MAG: tyrosine-type recombinase/integrase [Deltaproteobacteria bacterium]|nr:tyrosine-type recombinase/integrase [Deltaproteobacteria bacterium]